MRGNGFYAIATLKPDVAELSYCYPGALEGARVEGVGIEFFPDQGAPWFATFARGHLSPNAIQFLGLHPNGTHVVVAADGEGYVVNGADPADWQEIPVRPIMGALEAKPLGILVLWDFVRMICFDHSGIRWATRSISWDGIRDVAIDGDFIRAVVWDAPTAADVTATLAISDGAVVQGASSPNFES